MNAALFRVGIAAAVIVAAFLFGVSYQRGVYAKAEVSRLEAEAEARKILAKQESIEREKARNLEDEASQSVTDVPQCFGPERVRRLNLR